MKFDDIWNATAPPPSRSKTYAPVGIGRFLGDVSNAVWFRPVAFITAVFNRSARQ